MITTLGARALGALLPLPCLLVLACSPAGGDVTATGGAPTSGGTSGTGGNLSGSGGLGTGGSVNGSTGATGGGAMTSGGAPGGGGTGGSVSGGTGGVLATGGSGSGGASGGTSSGGAPASGGTVGSGGTVASGGSGGASGGTSSGGAQGGESCPSDATFCSGFEDADLPEGAVFKLNGDPATPWTAYFEVDSSVMKSGASSLRVRSLSEASGAYKMLAVPSGGATFWARFYIRSDVVLGEMDHNVFAQASGSDDPNDGTSVEFAEDVGIAFNSSDAVRWPEGYGRLTNSTNPYTLDAGAWYCVELHFDGAGQAQQLYVDGSLLIDAAGFPDSTKNFSVLKFGYNALHGTERQLWYDDVAVGPTRPGCL